jgi:maltose O-acetyltransferase
LLARLLLKPLPKHVGSRIRSGVLRLVGFNIGEGTIMWDLPEFSGGDDMISMLTIGRHCWLNSGIYLDLGAPIHIGDKVAIGHNVLFMTSSHQINRGPNERRAGPRYAKPITVGDRVWLGARCLILPGVTIGAGAVVAAGATVTQDVPPDCIVAGVPARIVRHIDDEEDVTLDAVT